MDSAIVNILVGLVGISAVLTVLTQLGKNLIESETDDDGREVGPRRYLAAGVILAGVVLGLMVGFVRKDHALENGLMWITAWAFAGYLIGAASGGLYGGLKSLFPGAFSSSGWLGGGRG
jgi:hypothetical protein